MHQGLCKTVVLNEWKINDDTNPITNLSLITTLGTLIMPLHLKAKATGIPSITIISLENQAGIFHVDSGGIGVPRAILFCHTTHVGWVTMTLQNQ